MNQEDTDRTAASVRKAAHQLDDDMVEEGRIDPLLAEEVVQGFIDLDNSIRNGGPLPSEWAKN